MCGVLRRSGRELQSSVYDTRQTEEEEGGGGLFPALTGVYGRGNMQGILQRFQQRAERLVIIAVDAVRLALDKQVGSAGSGVWERSWIHLGGLSEAVSN